MNRPAIGTLQGAARLDEESYIDFVEGMRTFNLSAVNGELRRVGGDVLGRMTGREAPGVEPFLAALDGTHIAGVRNALMRNTQEMMWKGVEATCATQAPALRAELADTDTQGPGSLRWDPSYTYPDYVEAVDIHLQPGSYHTEDLAGYVYHYGTKVFFLGANDRDEVHEQFVMMMPAPDHPVTEVLDLACSVGQSTTALKKRFPDAHVTGIDIAAPMVRYAHARAVRMGVDVDFVQQNVESLEVADHSVDVVYANILFHELPLAATKNVIAEVLRVLRPGGIFFVVDFPRLHLDGAPSVDHYMRNFDTHANGEMYASDFAFSDFDDQLVAAFTEADVHFGSDLPLPLQIRMCRA